MTFTVTRLTHSLEAAQIGASLINQFAHSGSAEIKALLPDENLMERHFVLRMISATPPFGHGGRTALNYKMLGSGGFEGNVSNIQNCRSP